VSVQAPAVAAAGPAPVAGNRSEYPVVGVVAVMLGAVISTLSARITTTGLADIRGALGLGFDDGSWIGTVFLAAQIVVAPAAAWMSTVLSTRRVLLWTGAVFTIGSLLPPFTHDLYGVFSVNREFEPGYLFGTSVPSWTI
jgi:MFS transporter, DHA2 family, multidrug resistance protein